MDSEMNGEESKYAWDSRVGGAVSSRNRHRRREQTCGSHRGKQGGMTWETGIDIYTLLLLLSRFSPVRLCATP